MMESIEEAVPRSSLDFAESSVLEAVAPAHVDLNIEDELASWDGKIEDDGGSIVPFILQRNVLLLDEKVPVLVVFRTPLLDDDILESYVARLAVNLDAFAFSTAPQPEVEGKSGSTKETIYSTTIPHTEKPLILRHGNGDDANTYVVWRIHAFISRPQSRFHKPAVYFHATASFKPAPTPTKVVPEDEYLPSGVPTAINLLQAFENDPALAGVHPRLSAMRISKIAPSSSNLAKELVRPIRSGQRPIFRVLPALVWRVRYTRIQTSLNDLSLMASIDLEIAPYHSYDVRIKDVNLSLHGGNSKPFIPPTNPSTLYKPSDQINYLYKITPNLSADGTPILGPKGHYLTLQIDADVQISPHCHPIISIDWKTPVDFTPTLEQSPTLMKAAHRLSNPTTQFSKPSNPDALPAHDTSSQPGNDAANADINLTLTISGPPKVTVGEPFTWSVFIINRSDKPRKLAILVLPKRKRDATSNQNRPSTSSSSAPAGPQARLPSSSGAATKSSEKPKELLASAVADENIVYARQKSARSDAAELICLTTDIRLGQLAPGSCYTADLKFLALREGSLGVESVRVIDLATNETADVRDLPSVVAVAVGSEE